MLQNIKESPKRLTSYTWVTRVAQLMAGGKSCHYATCCQGALPMCGMNFVSRERSVLSIDRVFPFRTFRSLYPVQQRPNNLDAQEIGYTIAVLSLSDRYRSGKRFDPPRSAGLKVEFLTVSPDGNLGGLDSHELLTG